MNSFDATLTAAREIAGNALSKGLLLLVCLYSMGARWKKQGPEYPGIAINAGMAFGVKRRVNFVIPFGTGDR